MSSRALECHTEPLDYAQGRLREGSQAVLAENPVGPPVFTEPKTNISSG